MKQIFISLVLFVLSFSTRATELKPCLNDANQRNVCVGDLVYVVNEKGFHAALNWKVLKIDLKTQRLMIDSAEPNRWVQFSNIFTTTGNLVLDNRFGGATLRSEDRFILAAYEYGFLFQEVRIVAVGKTELLIMVGDQTGWWQLQRLNPSLVLPNTLFLKKGCVRGFCAGDVLVDTTSKKSVKAAAISDSTIMSSLYPHLYDMRFLVHH